jgi:large subunit ribosomal protein L10
VNRLEKKETVASMNEAFNNSTSVVVSLYQGITVAQMTELRRNSRASGTKFKICKNSLLRLAVKNTPFEELTNLFSGPTAIAFANDPVAVSKTMVEYSEKCDKLVILGGMIDKATINVDNIKILAKLPPLDHLRAKIIGLLNAPATKIACILQAPAGQVARVINAYATKE